MNIILITAGLLAHGSMRWPAFPMRRHQWQIMGNHLPLTVAGAAPALSRKTHRIPLSRHEAERRNVPRVAIHTRVSRKQLPSKTNHTRQQLPAYRNLADTFPQKTACFTLGKLLASYRSG
jgi:hypothetical protein